ncbi:MAG: ABC transporter substrate-binding protein [bacterium]|nr:ABC transporter substrate-binding protein [bacterium]
MGHRPCRAVGLLAAVFMLASACGGSSVPSGDQQEPSTPQPAGPPADASGFLDDGPELVIGLVLPETGSLSYLYPPLSTGVRLATEDIQAAGGRVRIIEGDSGTDPDLAAETVNRLLGEGADVILGAAASGVSQSIIQTLYETEVVQCSGSNTSPNFSIQQNAEYFFRTVTTAEADAPVMANNIARGGATNVAILARADDWGQSLSALLHERLAELNVASEVVPFSQEASNFEDVVLTVEQMGADTVAVLAFAEGIQLIRRLLEASVPPAAIHGGPGLFDVELPSKVSPGSPDELDGFTVYGASGGDDFNQRISEAVGGNIAFGGQYYDCTVMLALAALAAGSRNGPDLIAVVPGLSRGGRKCTAFEECASLLAEGADIDYDGASGPLELDDVGDTTVGRYAVAEVRQGVLEVVKIEDVTMAP